MVQTGTNKPKNVNVTDVEKANNRKVIIGILAAIVVGFIAYNIIPVGDPKAGFLSAGARGLVTIFLMALILWITEALPIAVTSLLVLIISPMLGVFPSIKDAATGFTSPVIFFVIGTFAFSYAVEHSGMGRRFALWLITRSGTSSKTAILVFMIGCGIVSAVMSDVAATAIWMSLSMPIINRINAQPGKSNFAKAMMIGLPIGAFAGGVATPAGSSINILTLSLLKEIGKIEVTFVQWMAIGVPLFLIVIFAAWFVIIKMIPPEIETIGSFDEYKKEQDSLGKWTAYEKKTAIIAGLMMVCWIAGSWIKQLDITTVAIAGGIVMFLPGVKLFGWKEIEKSGSWDLVLLVGTVTSLGMAASNTGLAKWVVDHTIGGIGQWPLFAALLAISILIVFVHIPIPINPSIVAAFTPAMIVLATEAGINPAYFVLMVGFTASCAFLLPLDTVTLITFSKGYYKMFDLAKPGLIISVVWVLVSAVLFVLIGPMIGF